MIKKAVILVVSFIVLILIHPSFAQQKAPLKTAPIKKDPSQLPVQKMNPQVRPAVIIKNRVIISSSDFQALVSGLFKNAKFLVNSCGGSYGDRKSTIYVPPDYQSIEPLGRLDSVLPLTVQQQTMREAISYSKNPPVIRDYKIRACMDNLSTYPWKGFVENKRFKIRLQFSSNLFVKTRILEQEKTSGGWKNRVEWKDKLTDSNVPDYFYVAPCLDVYLTPVVQDGILSYGNVEVNWYWYEDKGFVWPEGALVSDPFAVPHGHPMEKLMILQYKTDVMNALKQRIFNAFNHNAIRIHLKAALTDKVKSGDFSNRTIDYVSGSESSISVWFK